MNILVVGGNGFIGSHIVDALMARGETITIFDRQREIFRPERQDIQYHYGDFEDSKEIEEALKGMDTVIHLVSTTIAQTSNQNPAFDVQSNVIGTIGLLECCRRQGVNKIVMISSGGVIYGIPNQIPIPETHPTNPLCSYGITKLTIEKYLHLYFYLYGIKYVVLRCANPYGERQNPEGRQGAVGVFLTKAEKDEDIVIWGDGEVIRDFFYISDLVNACLSALYSDISDKIYNVGSGVGTSINQLLDVIRKVTSRELRVKYTPARDVDVPVNILDISLAKKELGWRPEVILKDGVERTWSWISRLSG